MRILLDEDVPVQVLEILRRVLVDHEIDHVDTIRWKGKKDPVLIPNAASRGYDVLVTNDLGQLNDPDECRAIRRARIHHVTFRIGDGLRGLALAVAAIVAAMPRLVDELAGSSGQRLGEITSVKDQRRHTLIDPRKDPPPYW